MEKTVAIAMATYNGSRFLRQQLDSLYNQTKIPDEVVVCDDNSSDNTCDILEEYHIKYGLKYYVNDKSLGVNANFYKVVSLCNSDYIAICDQDDIWLPNKIEITYNKLCEIDDGSPCCVSSLCNHIDAQGNVTSMTTISQIDTFGCAATLLTVGRSQGCSLMFNNTLKSLVLYKIKQFPKIAEDPIYDAFFSFSAAMVGKKYNIGIPLMLYRHHENNVIAKSNIGVKTFKEKLYNREYYEFIPQSRFSFIEEMSNIYGDLIKNEDEKKMISNIVAISKSSHLKSFYIIIKMREMSLKRRISIICGTIAMDFLKIFIKQS